MNILVKTINVVLWLICLPINMIIMFAVSCRNRRLSVAAADEHIEAAEWSYIIYMARQENLTQEDCAFITFLTEYGRTSEVRAFAMLFFRKRIASGKYFGDDPKRKQQIVDALEELQSANQFEIRSKLCLPEAKHVKDHCLSLCMELEAEGKIERVKEIWKIPSENLCQKTSNCQCGKNI